LLLAIGLLWGGITAFSMASEDWATKAQGLGLAVALFLGMVALGAPILFLWFRLWPGMLLTLHVVAALASGLWSGSELESMVRYVALAPAFSILLASVCGGEEDIRQLRIGFTLAGMVFAVFHLFNLELAELSDPAYRLTVFLNPNGTGFIAALTGVSALDLGLNQARAKTARVLWLVSFVACGLLWFSTKSRTALLAFMAGVLIIGAFHLQARNARFALTAALALALLFTARFKGFFVDTLSLDDQYRSIATATGRFGIWEYILTQIFPEAPLLGVGPGRHADLVSNATGCSSAHNGLLMALAETGLSGTVPLVLLLLLGSAGAWRHRHDPGICWAVALFAAGFMESLGEVMFFSIGNPASLLFMLAVAALTLRDFQPRDTAEPVIERLPAVRAS
jgi:O-antigen ligase